MSSLSQRHVSYPTPPSAWQPTLPDVLGPGKPRFTWVCAWDNEREQLVAAPSTLQVTEPEQHNILLSASALLWRASRKKHRRLLPCFQQEKEFTFVGMLKDFRWKRSHGYLYIFTGCTDTQVQMLSWKLWLHNSINFVWVLRPFLGAFRNLQEIPFLFIYV